MASTYSTNLKIQLMGTGENTGTWGNVTNVNLGTALEEAIVGNVDVTFASADVTLTLTNTNATQTARNLRLNLIGTSGGARQLIVPAVEKVYIVRNGLADTVTVRTSGGAGVAIPTLKTMWVYSDGIDVLDVTTHLTSLTLGTPLPVASGGTGINSVGSSGNVLTSNGSVWVSQAIGSAFTSGMIMLWSGAIITIPVGWALCDGNNGTPDLRDKFIVGAGSTYAVGGTGGSPNAIVVSHTHTGTTAGAGSHSHNVVADVGSGGGSTPWSGGTYLRQYGSSGDSAYRLQGTNAAVPTVGESDTEPNHTHTFTTNSSGSSGTNANLPPYYALAYIMKL